MVWVSPAESMAQLTASGRGEDGTHLTQPFCASSLHWHGINWLCHMLQSVTGRIAQPGPLMSPGIYFSANNRNRNSFVGYIQMDEALALQSPSFVPFPVVKDEIV